MENENIEQVYDTKEDLCEKENTIFTVAKAEYKDLVKYLLDKILPARKEFERKFENTEFTLKQGLIDLDIILQYSVIELEYKNGHIRDEVIGDVEGVCENGSIMNEIRYTDEFFNWIDFNSNENEESGKTLKSMASYISKVSKDFAKFFVFVDPSEEDINFRNKVQQKMNNIINVLVDRNKESIGSEKRPVCLANAIFKQLVK